MSEIIEVTLELEAAWREDPAPAFELGVELAFGQWEVLSMAVEQGWSRGGHDHSQQLREQFIDATIDLFLTSTDRLHWDDLSDYLYDGLLNEFHVDAQDESEVQIAKLLCQLYEDCITKRDFSGVKTMLAHRRVVDARLRQSRAQARIEMSDNDSDNDNENDSNDDRDDNDDDSKVAEQLESLQVDDRQSQPQPRPQASQSSRRAPAEADDDGWTTVKGKGKRR